MSGYSLWTEKWIPVQPLEGRPTKVSLPQALIEAHNLRGIADPSPLITVALHRLLLALLYRTHPLHQLTDWRAIWVAGCLDASSVANYGDPEWFDLLHPSRPFYQVPYMAGERVHPVAGLVLEAASGNNPALFDHGRVEGGTELPLDRAACYLVAHQLFAIGGGVSKPFNRMDGPLTKGIVVEVMGQTLFETLMLNAMDDERWRQLAPRTEQDRPFWEERSPEEPVKEGTVVRGPLHYLTWQSRQIHLVVDREQQVVSGCQIAQRYCLPKDGTRVDPGKAYRQDAEKQTGWMPQRLQKDRAAWRVTHVLLQSASEEKTPPQVVQWLAALRRREEISGLRLPRSVSLSVSGLTTDPKLAAKIDLWRREEIGLPLAVIENPDLISRVDQMMTTAERVERLLRRTAEALVWALSERQHQKDALHYLWSGKTGQSKLPPTTAPVARSYGITLRYWSAMEGPFREALWRLPDDTDMTVEADWANTLRQNASAAVDSTLQVLQSSGAPWEPLSLIQASFGRSLHRSLVRAEAEEGENRDDDE